MSLKDIKLIYILIGAAIVVILGGVGYALDSSQDATGTRTYVDRTRGISVDIPEGWVVLDSYASSKPLIIQSPDYKERDIAALNLQMGEAANNVERGARFEILTGDWYRVDPSINTPAAYVAFTLQFRKDCSNCIYYKQIDLDGQPAVQSRVRYDYLGDSTHIGTVREGNGLQITFLYDSLTPEKEKVLSQLLSNFKFIEAPKHSFGIGILSSNGGDTYTIGEEAYIAWESINVPEDASVRLEVLEVSGDKPEIDATGMCTNCTGGSPIMAASVPLVEGAQNITWEVGQKLFPLHTPVTPGMRYVLMAVAERPNTDEESKERCREQPSGVCSKPFSVLLGLDYSDRVFSIQGSNQTSSVERITWHIDLANPEITNPDDPRQNEQAISVDITFNDQSTKSYDLGSAYGCTGLTFQSQIGKVRVMGEVNCYFALSAKKFVAYVEDGRFVVEQQVESAKDGSVETTVLLKL